MRLYGRIAIVTGGGRGIGRACALRLAAEGAHVVVSDIDSATAESTAREVTELGRRSLAMPMDVTRREASQEMVARTIDEFGRIDILVNNAGIIQVKSWLELTDEDIDRTFDVNIKGVIFASQAVAHQMIEQRSGRIINIASVAAKTRGGPLFVHYSASKAAVVNLTRGIATYFAPFGVTCNSVCPGIVDTNMWEYLDEAIGQIEGRARGETLQQRITSIPLGRVQKVEDVSGVVAFLASDDASYMTGQSLIVDGGMFME